MACRDTGSTGLSRRTWHFHLPGKCRVFPRKRFTFPPRPTGVPAPQAPLVALGISTPRESAGLSSENGSLSPAADKGTGSTGISGGTRHSLPPGKCRVFRRKWFTFPRGLPGYRLHRPLWRHSPFPPPGKVPDFPAKTVHFPSCHETSEEVQQGMLGKVLSIQALWKRYSAGLGVKWWICGKKRAVQQILRIYILDNQCNAFEL